MRFCHRLYYVFFIRFIVLRHIFRFLLFCIPFQKMARPLFIGVASGRMGPNNNVWIRICRRTSRWSRVNSVAMVMDATVLVNSDQLLWSLLFHCLLPKCYYHKFWPVQTTTQLTFVKNHHLFTTKTLFKHISQFLLSQTHIFLSVKVCILV